MMVAPQPHRVVKIVDGRIVADVILTEAPMIGEQMPGLDLFKSFTPAELTHIAERMKRRRYLSGEAIIRQGEAGAEFYVIAQGEVEVLRRVEGGEEAKVAVLDKAISSVCEHS